MKAEAATMEVGSASSAPDVCPVCCASGSQLFLSVDGRDYWRCAICEARFLDPPQRPSREEDTPTTCTTRIIRTIQATATFSPSWPIHCLRDCLQT